MEKAKNEAVKFLWRAGGEDTRRYFFGHKSEFFTGVKYWEFWCDFLVADYEDPDKTVVHRVTANVN